jgi:hypothetical protein
LNKPFAGFDVGRPRSRHGPVQLVALTTDASFSGSATGDGHAVTVNMSWEGTGPIETTQNATARPGFVGHFTGKVRDAVATGTVVVNGETVVNGSTTDASIETLEDNNTTTSP